MVPAAYVEPSTNDSAGVSAAAATGTTGGTNVA
jgi:hypothetical protein